LQFPNIPTYCSSIAYLLAPKERKTRERQGLEKREKGGRYSHATLKRTPFPPRGWPSSITPSMPREGFLQLSFEVSMHGLNTCIYTITGKHNKNRSYQDSLSPSRPQFQ